MKRQDLESPEKNKAFLITWFDLPFWSIPSSWSLIWYRI